MPNPVRMSGAILRLHHDRGFAVLRSETGDKFFAHASAFLNYDDIDRAHVGARVTFDPGAATKDLPQARRVRLGAEAESVPEPAPDQPREGIVCRYSPARGCAWAIDQSGQRLLIHVSSMPRSRFEALKIGARIAFAAVVESERGPKAEGVVLLD